MISVNRITFALLLSGIFATVSLLCCTAPALAHADDGHSCCASKHKSDGPSHNDCHGNCPLALKSVDVSSAFTLAVPQNLHLSMIKDPVVVFKAAHLIAPVPIHGPPGAAASVPLYIHFHCLRI